MSWHCSRALVEEFLAENCLDGALSALSSSTPTPDQFYWPDKTTEHSRLSRFGMTCAPLTEFPGEDVLTWFLAGFPAKTSAQLEKGQALKVSEADSGQKWHGSFARYSPDSYSWKTAQCSLLGGLDEFSETWPNWGLMRDGECWEAIMLEPPTVENASGLLPTPRASVGTHGICWKRAKNGEHRSQIEDFLAWLSLNHGGQVVPGRTVNPDFQDWLMVWPTQWTDLQPLEMDKFQSWQRQHSYFFPVSEAA